MLVGVISDTHGLLRLEAVEALRGSDLIVHAGDVGAPEVLDGLRQLAPVTAVRGNVDRAPWTSALPAVDVVDWAELSCTSCTSSSTSISIRPRLDLRPSSTVIRTSRRRRSERACCF